MSTTTTYGSGQWRLTVPTSSQSTISESRFYFTGRYKDNNAGTEYDIVGILANNTTTINLYCKNSSGTYVTLTALTSTVPFTGSTSDALTLTGWYNSTS